MEIIVSPNRDIVTLINVFAVEPGNQEKLIEVLKEGTEALFGKQPGYVSASFHKSKDGRRVVNYGQWRSPQTSKPIGASPRSARTSSACKSWHSSNRWSAT